MNHVTNHCLYRHFDANGVLLYVGISQNLQARCAAHQYNTDWFREIAKVTVEHFQTRAEARWAEMTAIQAEKPKHNVIHAERAPRARKGHNLYLPSDLVEWATEYAKSRYGISVSTLVEKRLQRIRDDVARSDARRSKKVSP